MTEKKHLEVLQWIRNYQRAYQWAPTIREVGKAFGWASASTAHKCLIEMEKEGWIERGKGNRQLKLTARGKEQTE